MLSDEEKKAIVELNHFSNMTAYWKQEEYTNSEIDNYIKIVLNLIEKKSKEIERKNEILIWKQKHEEQLQKEIEELKYKYSDEKIRNTIIKRYREVIEKDYVSKDKIKAKIEELENYYRELYKQDNSPNEFLIGQDCLSKLSILQEVKQSLLEKE